MSQNHSMPGESHSPTPDKAVQAVLFDRDGVLTYFDIDEAIVFFRPLIPISLPELAARWQAFGDLNGFPRNLAEEKSFFANFWEQLADEFRLTQGQRTALGSLDYTRFIVPYPEVRSVLNELNTSPLRLGVLSNFSLASLEQSLVTTGLAKFFYIICAAPVIGAAKPSPRAYEIALDGLRVKPEQCLFFDDETECVEGARKLGLRAYLLDRQAPMHDLARFVVTDLRAVPELALPRRY